MKTESNCHQILSRYALALYCVRCSEIATKNLGVNQEQAKQPLPGLLTRWKTLGGPEPRKESPKGTLAEYFLYGAIVGSRPLVRRTIEERRTRSRRRKRNGSTCEVIHHQLQRIYKLIQPGER